MKFYPLLVVLLLINQLSFSQTSKFQPKDTTDSNSIVRRVHRIKELEVRTNMSVANIKSGSSGINIDISELKKLPNIIGDADPFKSLQYMGGISQAGDASANMTVRGGNNDQNLVLLNGCVIQNPTHVLGLFSVFNPDLIDQMKYIKTGIPAEYGGRLSSVVDIKNFSNIPGKLQIDGSAGLIASRLSVRMPLNKKLSLYASQRGSYIGSFVIPMLVKFGIDNRLAQNNFEFSDTNAGINYVLSPDTKISAHFYSGNDRISVSQNLKYSIDDNSSKWGNKALGVQLNHIFSDRFSMVHYLNATEFFLNSKVNWLTNNYLLNSHNKAIHLKSDFVYILKQHALKAGLETSVNQILPAKITQSETTNSETAGILYKNQDFACYIRDEWETGNLVMNFGLRANYQFINPDSTPLSANFPVRNHGIYGGIEPRLFSRWLVSKNSSLKFSASKHYQHLNRVQVVNFGVPLEIIIPASAIGKSASLWHFSGGYFQNLYENKWEMSAEIYYKSFSNLLEYGGTLNDLFSEQQLIDRVYSGKGRAYGAEFMLKKNEGRFTGWLNYTLGWNYRQFDDINQGKAYLATNDRRHDLSVIGMYQLTNKISLSATFVYASGSRLNLPRSWFILDNKVVLEYGKFNSFQMPDYHRLDISMNYKLKPFLRINSELNFAVYNLYNRANPFQVYFSTLSAKNTYDYKIKMSYLIPVLPSISWVFHY